MKTQLRNPILLTFLFLYASIGVAQVGINTTSPMPGSMLDVTSTDKGILVPRVNITDLSTIAPVTGGATESLLVYNTNLTTGKGFHYWDGTQWVPFAGNPWKILGNTGTNPSINFLGTTDNVSLRFRTNNTEQFEITTGGLLRAYNPGTLSTPLLSWDADSDTGLFRGGDDTFNFGAGGLEFLRLTESGNSQLSINNDANDIDTRISTLNLTNGLFVNAGTDNVGLGTNTPNPSAQMELADNNRGMLVNRVALSSTIVAAPVTAPATGLLVYNTANASSGATEVIPGFYYWVGNRWIAMGGTGGRDWSLDGNAGTNAFTNFIGTTDVNSFVVKTSNLERMRVDAAGTVGIGNLPYGNAALRVNNPPMPYGIVAETSNNGVAIFGNDTGTGIGMFGTSSNNHGVYGTTAFTGSAFLIGGVIGWGTGASRANGVLAVANEPVTSGSNVGLRAVSGGTTSISTGNIFNIGINTNATDLGLYSLTEGPITTYGDLEAARFQTNFTGNAITADARDPRAQIAGFTANSMQGPSSMYYGAFLYSGGVSSNASYAYAGARYGTTNYKIIGNGAVSTIVEDTQGDKKVMFAAEAPEVLFEDYGVGQLNNGVAQISIDPIFSNNIQVDSQHPLKVFIQLEGDCNGVFVTNKTANGFMVKELANGTSNVSFSWHLVANRKDAFENGQLSKYADLRFPDAPKAIEASTNSAEQVSKFKPDRPTVKE